APRASRRRAFARHGKDSVALAAGEKARLLEALGAESGDPDLAMRVIDHRDDHLAGALVEPELNGNQHNGKKNADERNREAHAVMNEVAERKRQYHGKCRTL